MQPIISWQDFSSIMVDGFLVVAICVSGIAFAPILYQDMICLRASPLWIPQHFRNGAFIPKHGPESPEDCIFLWRTCAA